VRQQGVFDQGQLHGKLSSFDASGHCLWVFDYEHGEQNGLRRHWYPNGLLRSAGDFYEGRPQGLHQEWYSSGQLKSTGHYAEGRPVGHWRRFLPDGSPDERLSRRAGQGDSRR
jgi:antitoxin component YwqK of YwqJK toxin-antitoxin module